MRKLQIIKTSNDVERFYNTTVSGKMQLKLMNALVLIIALVCLLSCAATQDGRLIISRQGSFSVGGTVIANPGTFDPYHPTPAGQTFHGDHAYVFYQIPVNARKFPLVMWHGIGQFSKTWETTPDGREGYQNIFCRRRFPVYVIDQPRRGDAGRSTVTAHIEPIPDEQQWFDTFRIGIWPNRFEGVQFARDSATLEQYFRAMTPSIGPIDVRVNVEAVSALFDKIGPADSCDTFSFGWNGLAYRCSQSECKSHRFL